MSETFQVVTIIKKLLPAWNDFKNYLKHERKEMNVEQFISRLRIKVDNRSSKRKEFNLIVPKANVGKHGQNSRSFKNKFWPSGGKWLSWDRNVNF